VAAQFPRGQKRANGTIMVFDPPDLVHPSPKQAPRLCNEALQLLNNKFVIGQSTRCRTAATKWAKPRRAVRRAFRLSYGRLQMPWVEASQNFLKQLAYHQENQEASRSRNRSAEIPDQTRLLTDLCHSLLNSEGLSM
jgi:hypothetical protein